MNIKYKTNIEENKNSNMTVEETNFHSINKNHIGKRLKFTAKVNEVFQTGGPTVFSLHDGTGALRAVAFTKAGQRSYPEINQSDVVDIQIEIKERDNAMEGEIISMYKVDDNKRKLFDQQLISSLENKSKPEITSYMIKSKKLDTMKNRFIKMATIIREAIFEQRPIIIKHHADCDGYSAAIALERAILPMIIDEHKSEKAAWQFYKRTPSKAPFYDYLDATKDISFFTSDTSKFGVKTPLIILADNGSTEEDILSIKKVCIYGAKVIVIDHHNPGEIINGKAKVDEFIDCHINPHLFGYDSNITAGMLCSELSRFINKEVKNINFLPALSGITDKSNCEEFDKYLELSNMDKNFLEKLGACVDFEAHYLKFTEGRGLVNVLFGEDREKQKQLVQLLYKDINERFERQKLVVKKYANVKETDKIVIVRLALENITIRESFPAAGKTAGVGHDLFKKENKGIITIGSGSDFVVFRCDNVEGFDVNKIVKELKQNLPHTLADGGGHAYAGSIKFVSAAKQEILDFIDKYIERFI